ncbi:hypothetical protein UFOVP250_47 [uncultured Caudovirales phage]|uniref:Uncharacterized protein n=1 Tax=uncultured Caudovirales phage TaxID=2100421 RepID=A0A6J5LHW2_9CAUD|nr:hypothetical protein UFOVP250_47 [uncultured Caudovirales phage]
MSTFVEVNSVEKGCPVIINLDHVIEIVPLKAGGCSVFYADSAAVGGKTDIKVTDSYLAFKQFALETVSAEDIAKKVKKLKETVGE